MTNTELPDFIPGLDLSQSLFDTAVEPVLTARFPDLSYSAAHLGSGSDVLGFDTPLSRDHGWGPKVTLFVGEADLARRGALLRALAEDLPPQIEGYPTNFTRPDFDRGMIVSDAEAPVQGGVTVTTLREFSMSYLGVDATQSLDPVDWLRISSQRLCTVRSGRVFADRLGAVEPFRARLHWYPRDVWLYRLAAAWRRIDQEEPFVGRCGDVDDALGSRVVAARLIIELMRLAFLIERRYAPYMKWLGTAFKRLEVAGALEPTFHAALDATGWREREAALNEAYGVLGRAHNALGLTEPVEVRIASFFSRPYQVPHSHRFVEALLGAIVSDRVRDWPSHVGGVDQFVDSTDVTDRIERMAVLGAAFGQL